jgi:hypothetical protein
MKLPNSGTTSTLFELSVNHFAPYALQRIQIRRLVPGQSIGFPRWYLYC